MAQDISKKETTQTAVEWLIEKQLDAGIGLPKEWREQAKAMEKEQIEWSWVNGKISTINKENKSSEQYYNETYAK